MFRLTLPSGNSLSMTVPGGPPSMPQRQAATPTPRATGIVCFGRSRPSFQPNVLNPSVRDSHGTGFIPPGTFNQYIRSDSGQVLLPGLMNCSIQMCRPSGWERNPTEAVKFRHVYHSAKIQYRDLSPVGLRCRGSGPEIASDPARRYDRNAALADPGRSEQEG